MNQQQIELFRSRLRTLLAEIDEDIDSIGEATHQASGGQGIGEITNVPFHLGDMGTEEFLFQMNSALLNNEEQLRTAVIEALRRIDSGTYGQCSECGQAIAPQRLEALPFTAVCVQCASNQPSSSTNLNVGRPKTPEDTLAPEGDMGEERWPRSADDDQVAPAGENHRMTGNRHEADIHAAGTPGGGSPSGGLAGSNFGHGDPRVAEAEDAMGDGTYDPDNEPDDRPTPQAGRAGGAVGGTPAGKRSSSD